MTLLCSAPRPEDVVGIARLMSSWQVEPWPGHLHPGDLGWHSSVGSVQIAQDLRVWQRQGEPVAVGMLDGPEVLRLAVAPAVTQDVGVAERIVGDLESGESELFAGGEAVVEARGATTLRAALAGAGWVDDEPGRRCRWTEIMTGPFADLAHSLVAYDPDGAPVAVTTVWSAGRGRPGLVEPMGVHREHHGKGYGVAVTLAGAHSLQGLGASSVVVVAESSNPAAIATYRSAASQAWER